MMVTGLLTPPWTPPGFLAPRAAVTAEVCMKDGCTKPRPQPEGFGRANQVPTAGCKNQTRKEMEEAAALISGCHVRGWAHLGVFQVIDADFPVSTCCTQPLAIRTHCQLMHCFQPLCRKTQARSSFSDVLQQVSAAEAS
uniref:Uncharacterized protein n=1 Tax=Pseudonaja textilis TaxID=8673 RepID=A0A670Z4N0_PSETE